MNFVFLPEADEEFREASRYYENEAPGVGLAFITEVHRVISVIVSHPVLLGKYEVQSAVKCFLISPTTCSIPLNLKWFLLLLLPIKKDGQRTGAAD
jgi:hypothetical protein